jgi:Ca2+-binding EF-hand superfamily protein
MGNLISYSKYPIPPKDLSTLVDSCYKFLCNCTSNIGPQSEITKLHNNYLRFHCGKSFYCVKSEIKRISYDTNLEGNEDILFTYLTVKSFTKVNIMNVFAAVIFLAEMSWLSKISTAFTFFDFDGSKTITEDELFIMFKCFIEAISLITNGIACSNLVIKGFIESANCDVLTLDE